MMARFCTKCGRELDENRRCSYCSANKNKPLAVFTNVAKRFLAFIMSRIGLGCATPEETLDVFERKLSIVPDILKPNDGETPIKQYEIAKLRSRLHLKRADGRLQVTNKRIIFRAAGISPTGKNTLQYEFRIEEIGGLEVKKSHRLSVSNVFLTIIMTGLVDDYVADFFHWIESFSTLTALLMCYGISTVALVLFFLVKKKFWLKYLILSFAVGANIGIYNFSIAAIDTFLGNFVFGLNEAVLLITGVFWLVNLFLVCFVPDLRISIKTKSAGEAIQIRRKVRGIFRKQPTEYTDFSTVCPWTDTDQAIVELGAMIDDLQTMGDYAIEKWKVDISEDNQNSNM